jgi:hypothetical protein
MPSQPAARLNLPPTVRSTPIGQTVRGKSGITVLAEGPVTINGAPGAGPAGAFVPDGAGPLSIVARANTGTRVTNNFFRLGPINAKAYSEAIEMTVPWRSRAT